MKEAGCRYGFSPEDTYAFLFVHMAKHFRRYGIGPRQLVDLHVYRQAHPELDMKRVERIMETIRLRKFHTNILHLLDRWFGEAQWDGLTWTITEYVFSGGNWGLVENAMRYDAVLESSRSGDRGSRSKALWRQVFPPLEVLQCRYPVLLKHPERYRVYYAVRWKDILLHNRQNVGKKLSIVRDLDDETVRNHREFLLSMGLDITTEE